MTTMQVAQHAQPLHIGQGRIGVLFLHGFNSSPHSMREWAKLTADAGYRVAVPRLPGHGTHWRELNATRWRDWYCCAEREFRSLAANCDQVFVAGHSMGGALALRLAALHPDQVAGLALVNPALLPYGFQRIVPIASLVMASVPSRAHDVARIGIERHGYDQTPLAPAVSMFQMFADVRASIEMDNARVEHTEDHYDRDRAALRSEEQTLERITNSNTIAIAGVPGAESNIGGAPLPAAGGAAGRCL